MLPPSFVVSVRVSQRPEPRAVLRGRGPDQVTAAFGFNGKQKSGNPRPRSDGLRNATFLIQSRLTFRSFRRVAFFYQIPKEILIKGPSIH